MECQGDYLNEGETVEDNDEDESGEEITGLEEVVTSVVNDLSNDYTDDEDDDDYDASELQPLSAPLTCKITKMGSQQHENIHDTEPLKRVRLIDQDAMMCKLLKEAILFPRPTAHEKKK